MLWIESYNITIRMFIYPYLFFFFPFITSSMEFMSAKFYILLTFLKNKKKLHKELPGRYHFSSMRGLKFLSFLQQFVRPNSSVSCAIRLALLEHILQ